MLIGGASPNIYFVVPLAFLHVFLGAHIEYVGKEQEKTGFSA